MRRRERDEQLQFLSYASLYDMQIRSDGKPANCVMRIGARTLEFGVEALDAPLIVRNVFKYGGKSPSAAVDAIDYDFDHSLSVDLVPQTSYSADVSIYNHLFPVSLVVFKGDFAEGLRRHLMYIMLDIFEKSGVSHVNVKMVLVWHSETPRVYLEALTDVLLNHFLLRSVVVVPDALMVSIGSGANLTPEGGAIVLDFGWRHTRLNVIYDNRVLEEYTTLSTLSGCRCHYNLKAKLNGAGLAFRDVEKVISALSMFEVDNEAMLEINGHVVTEGEVVQSIVDTLFPNVELDRDEQTCSSMLADTFKRLPVDLRGTLRNRVIITGGLTKIRGFSQYVGRRLCEKQPVGCIQSLGAWRGASLYSAKVLRHAQRHVRLQEVRRTR